MASLLNPACNGISAATVDVHISKKHTAAHATMLRSRFNGRLDILTGVYILYNTTRVPALARVELVFIRQ
jgi:hypothetical protein